MQVALYIRQNHFGNWQEITIQTLKVFEKADREAFIEQ